MNSRNTPYRKGYFFEITLRRSKNLTILELIKSNSSNFLNHPKFS